MANLLPSRQLNFGRSQPQNQFMQQQLQQLQQQQHAQIAAATVANAAQLALPSGPTIALPGSSGLAFPGTSQPAVPKPPVQSNAVAGPSTPPAAPAVAATPAPLTLEQQHITAVEGIIPTLQNIVATVNLDCRLDLKTIALHARNAEYNPKVSICV